MPEPILSENAPAFVQEDAFEIHFQRLRVGRFGQRFLFGDFAVFDEWKSAWLKFCMPSSSPVSMAAGSLSRRFSSISFFTVAVLIMISSAGVMPPPIVLHHALANDGLQRAGQLPANLLALFRFEEVENAADGLRGVGGVQGGEHQMAGIGSAHGGRETDANRAFRRS